MIVQMFDPDREYARLQNDPDKTKAVRFLRQEAICFIKIKHMIDQCNCDDDYATFLPKMVEISEHIRNISFKCLEKQYGIFDFKKKEYIRRLRQDMNFSNKEIS